MTRPQSESLYEAQAGGREPNKPLLPSPLRCAAERQSVGQLGLQRATLGDKTSCGLRAPRNHACGLAQRGTAPSCGARAARGTGGA